jgi:putative transposase
MRYGAAMTRKPYPTDLTDAQWAVLEPLLPPAPWWGRPRTVDMREVINAILYVTRTGCRWRDLPHDFPKASTVYYYFTHYLDEAWWEAINDALRVQLREEAGRNADPSAVIIDSQSVKSTAIPGERGYDAGKKVNGRKRSLIVDTMGLLMRVVVHAADVSDLVGGKLVAALVQRLTTTIRIVFGDQHYGGQFAEHAHQQHGWEVEVKQQPAGAAGFVVVAKRWIVERTLGWLTWYRRLSKDYEQYPDVSEAFIYVAMIHLMLRRLKPAGTL